MAATTVKLSTDVKNTVDKLEDLGRLCDKGASFKKYFSIRQTAQREQVPLCRRVWIQCQLGHFSHERAGIIV